MTLEPKTTWAAGAESIISRRTDNPIWQDLHTKFTARRVRDAYRGEETLYSACRPHEVGYLARDA